MNNIIKTAEYKMYQAVIENNIMFRHMTEDELSAALGYLDASIQIYDNEEMLYKTGDLIDRFAIVLSGSISICMDEIDGTAGILGIQPPGRIIAQASCFLNMQESSVYFKAVKQSAVLWLSLKNLRENKDSKLDRMVRDSLLYGFAQSMFDEARLLSVLSKKSLRDKVLAFLYANSPDNPDPDGYFDLGLSRNEMALHLGCDRSSLSRTLSKLKDDKILDYRGSSFRLLEEK